LISPSSAVTPAAFDSSWFDHPKDPVPAGVIDPDRTRNRTGDVWHVWVKGIGPGRNETSHHQAMCFVNARKRHEL
jgi:hypothetical protein